MYGCESWTIKKAECQRIDAFELWFQPVHPKGDQSWVLIGRTDAKAETPILWPPHVKSWLIGKDWSWEGLGAGGEGDDRGWDGWMASPSRWTWVWVNSGSWWLTGRPGMLQSMGSKRVGHDWVTELNWTELMVLRLVWDCSMHFDCVNRSLMWCPNLLFPFFVHLNT